MIALWLRFWECLAILTRVTKDIWRALKPCRFSAFAVLLGGGMLLLTDQGEEAVVWLAGWDGETVWSRLIAGVLFFIAVFLWAFQSWYWARLMIDFQLGRRLTNSGREEWLKNHLPRILGLAPYLIAAAAFIVNWHPSTPGAYPALVLAILSSVQGIFFYWFLIRRRQFADILRVPRLKEEQPKELGGLADLPALSQAILVIDAAIILGATIWALSDPVGMGEALGSAALPFLGLSCIVPVGSFLVYLSRRQNLPVVFFLLAFAILVSGFNDNHAVRAYSAAPAGTPVPYQRATVDKALDSWFSCFPPSDRPVPLVIVATAGGGLRAAYWTATVLGAIQDAHPDFAEHLFAISGVSGGSLGAVTFVSLLREVRSDCGKPSVKPGGGFAQSGQAVLDRDFLAPLLTGLLYPDLLQRFIPVSVMPDRAQALEAGWEAGWHKQFPKSDWGGFSAPFSELWRPNADGQTVHRPALLLNGTHEETGKRIITSNLVIDPNIFLDAYDFYDLTEGEVRVSTAALNSSRFPYVNPPGTLRVHGLNVGHIIDGGYFENNGAVTAANLLREIRRWAGPDPGKVRPVLIQITSDPDLVSPDLAEANNPYSLPARLAGQSWGNELLGPLLGIFATRGGRGIEAAKELSKLPIDPAWMQPLQSTGTPNSKPPVYAHFRLCSQENYMNPGLGWLLSEESTAYIGSVVLENCNNPIAWDSVKEVFSQ